MHSALNFTNLKFYGGKCETYIYIYIYMGETERRGIGTKGK